MLMTRQVAAILIPMTIHRPRQLYREVAADFCLYMYMLPVYLPYFPALIALLVGKAVVSVLLAVLVMFLVAHRTEAIHAITTALKAFPTAWLAPVPVLGFHEICFASLAVPAAPRLTPLFQRPPPLFA